MKTKIIEELKKVKRPGVTLLIAFLEKSDFFTAPCSLRFHNNFPGGLAEHSWNVYQLFKEKNQRYNLGLSEETIIICGLLHDACKIDFYRKKTEAEKRKNHNNSNYMVDDKLSVGHGEKSVIVIQKYIDLTDEEIMIIRWHMGAFGDNLDNPYHGPAYYRAIELYPAALALQTADYEATTFLEKNES